MVTLIDTSIIIDHIRRQDKANSHLKTLSLRDHNSISIITCAELFSGKSIWESIINKNLVKKLCTNLTILPVTPKIAELAGKIKSFNRTDLIDSIIAATAIVHKLPLATLNTKDFSSIPHLKLAKLT